jgi:hypothetical protein
MAVGVYTTPNIGFNEGNGKPMYDNVFDEIT